jgi:hypothetical protein
MSVYAEHLGAMGFSQRLFDALYSAIPEQYTNLPRQTLLAGLLFPIAHTL